MSSCILPCPCLTIWSFLSSNVITRLDWLMYPLRSSMGLLGTRPKGTQGIQTLFDRKQLFTYLLYFCINCKKRHYCHFSRLSFLGCLHSELTALEDRVGVSPKQTLGILGIAYKISVFPKSKFP